VVEEVKQVEEVEQAEEVSVNLWRIKPV